MPAVLIVGAVAWVYVRYGTLPEVEGLLYGIKPVVMALVAQALWSLGRAAVKSAVLGVLGLAAMGAVAAGVHELVVLAGAAALMGTSRIFTDRPSHAATVLVTGAVSAASGATATVISAPAVSAPFGLWPLFLVFAKAGAVLFGSGYVLLAFLRADLVERLGWLSEAQLLDAVAIGQVTPGPVFTTATFVGYVLAGFTGAAIATIGIFLPAFVFVALSGPIVPRLRRSVLAGGVLDGVNVASLALMAMVSLQLAGAAIVDALTAGLAAASLVALAAFRINSAWLILVGATIGWLAR
jgi:chromate transporter